MGKLIFASSSTALEQQLPGINGGTPSSQGYYSITITSDGYFYTHGQKFRLYKVINGATEGFGLSYSNSNGNLVLTDGNTQIASVAVVGEIQGDSIITATRANNNNKLYTLTHAQPQNLVVNTTYGSAVTLDAVNVPSLTIDAYGHVTTISNVAINTTKVKGNEFNNELNNYYLIGVKNGDIQTPLYNTNIYMDRSGNFRAKTIYEDGDKLEDKYAAKQQATDEVTGTVLLSDAINSSLNAVSGKTAATPLAVKNAIDAANRYAEDLFTQNDALVFIGTITHTGIFKTHNARLVPDIINDTSSITASSFDYKAGYTMKFTDAGTLTLGSGNNAVAFIVEPGDVLLAINDKGDTFKGSDFTVIQNNISGALTSDTELNGIVTANSSRTLTAFAYPVTGTPLLRYNNGLEWTDASSIWRTYTCGGSSIQNKNIVLKTAIGEGTTTPFTIEFGTEGNNASITYTIHPNAIVTGSVKNLTIIQESTSFVYTPAQGNTLTIGNGLNLIKDNNDAFSLSHPTVSNYYTTGVLGRVTTDAFGHVTSIAEVTSLVNPEPLYIGTKTEAYGSYKGDAKLGLTFTAGTDVTITPTTFDDTNGMIYDADNQKTAGIDFKIEFAHKYRPISLVTNVEGTSVEATILANSVASALKFQEGTHITISNSEGTLTFNSTWRDIELYTVSSNTLVRGSLSDNSDLIFDSDFIADSDGLGICWTEIDTNGNITYVK